ncbi:hypothetical protein [Streptomyces europaeiscabiei]|uniref:hypothetical protein n=1 Tax=Streptomyces europaeiscabiei TaxID=146819 RepID=UPI0029AB26E1|nr:hypothetical protein [Streptomyces europaeiscabiei]MDX3589074.1 hypothetical protein [Streptomyces europaeiscabiei]
MRRNRPVMLSGILQDCRGHDYRLPLVGGEGSEVRCGLRRDFRDMAVREGFVVATRRAGPSMPSKR